LIASHSTSTTELFSRESVGCEARSARDLRFLLRGPKPEAHYRVSFEDGDVPSITRAVRDLMTRELTVRCAEPGRSQLVFLDREAAARRTPAPGLRQVAAMP
jgi:hypothetical protein